VNSSFLVLSQFQVLRNLCFRSQKKKNSGNLLTNLNIVVKFSASPKISSAIIILHIYPNFYTEAKKIMKIFTNNKQCAIRYRPEAKEIGPSFGGLHIITDRSGAAIALWP
jgi:hypothetical protein